MGSITPYESAHGRRYRVRYTKPDGTRTERRGFTRRTDAQLFLSSVTVAKAAGDYVDPAMSKIAVGYIADPWLRSKRPPMLKASSYAPLEQAWRTHVGPLWAHRELSSIQRSEVQAWVSDLASRRSRTVVLRSLGVLAGILELAVDDHRLRTNPARGVRSLPTRTSLKPRVYLSHAQVSTLAACSAHPALVTVLAYTGLRWGEATALRVRNVNRLRRRFTVEENAVMVGYKVHVGTPKTHRRRSVPYPERLEPLIAASCDDKGPEGLVFGDGVHHMRNAGEEGWFMNAVRRAQAVDPSIPRLTPHDLRHTAASLAISAGANAKAVQRMLGHASAAMTLDTYADLFEDDLDAVAKKLNEAMDVVNWPTKLQLVDDSGGPSPRIRRRL
ncbi:MAG: putative prophage phiRv2 integrase [Microbacterium sp.]|nr:putative prophage phiRv2 integrase [Microbacterium sp.]